ncbi:endoglucanase-1 [Plectosphaerella plurivora]|uniref:Endoglucanase-1 n=1 Tax=Plectosphaerella plurivora TaxID=936078 RepID=A0A9P8V3M0_9PEZI|nr:endoglucanase-1 [Plectosphaerella plurivora]
MKISAAFASLVALAAAAPGAEGVTPTKTTHLGKRAVTTCEQWGSVTTGSYIVYNNLWGRDSATSGSQCMTVDSISNGLLAWSTTWSWAGGQYNVKSYPNAVLQAPAARVSSVSSIPSRWQWSYSGSNLVANVAYDLFTNSNCGTTPEYEIMVWLGALGGAGPISASGSPIATVTIGGISWRLYQGAHSQMTVYSFVATSQQTNYNGNLNDFLRYLTTSQGFPGSQCLYSIGAGTEPFTGSNGRFVTSGYSVSLSTGGSTSPPVTPPTTPPPSGSCAARWAQCGGQGWTGATCCSAGTCTASNQWYSQCL